MGDPLNTHTYDGKLNTGLLPDLVLSKSLTCEQKRIYGYELIQNMRHVNKTAISFLKRIVKSIGTKSNFDSTNNLSADDLIYLCWLHRNNQEFIKVLEEQLMDMRTGFCPQGRTHRLFQSLLPFI